MTDDWYAALERFLAGLEQFDADHPNRWYSYYLSSLREEDKEAVAMLLRAALELKGEEEHAG